MSLFHSLCLIAATVVAALSLAASAATAGTYKLSTSADSSSPPNSFTAQISQGSMDWTDDAGTVVITCATFTVDSQGASVTQSGGGGAGGQTPSAEIHSASWAGCADTIFGAPCTMTPKTLPWAVTVVGDASDPSAPKLRIADYGSVVECPFIGWICRQTVPEEGFFEAKVTDLSSPLSATFSTANVAAGYSNALDLSQPSSAICPDPGRLTFAFTFTGETRDDAKVAIKLASW